MVMKLRTEKGIHSCESNNENTLNSLQSTPVKRPTISPRKSPNSSNLNDLTVVTTPIKRILSFDMKTPKKASPYSATKTLFYRSNKPVVMEARERERQLIINFLDNKVQKFIPSSIYISGNPGTGKSALIDELLATKRDDFEQCGIRVAKINCMSILESKRIFSQIMLELGIKISLQSASEVTSQRAFEEIQRLQKVNYFLLILDEVDCLTGHGENNVLYSLFDWTTNCSSRIGIVAISNTLDFTDRTLPRLLSKNVEPELVHFSAYTISQITQIINSKLSSCISQDSIIDPFAVELAARKIAACGDLRKALDTIKLSLVLAERDATPVSMKHILKALEGTTSNGNSKSTIIKELSLDAKSLLICMSAESKHKASVLYKHQLYQKYCSLASAHSWLNSLSRTEFDDLLTQLESKGLFSQSKLLKDGLVKITVQFTPQELSSTIQDSKYSNVTEICRREDGAGLDSTKIKVTVDDKDVYVDEGVNLIQACQLAGVEIPHFCYHKRLAIAGNCRMCLVEVEKVPKPVVSCAMPASPNMRVFTNTPMVKRAREGVMEFLLANHPLDCPICDQGGECDLQDQAMSYGADRSRMHEMKRAVEDKNFGPLVKTSMNRCIHCTRCVRFMNEVAGVDDLGTTGRGHMMQISTYLEKTLGSEVSGNIIDLCPVGALTSKPHAFKFRPWELKSTNSVDCMDGLGSAIRIDSRGKVVMRILPLENDSINEEWLSDKARFSCDGLAVQRIMNVCIKERNQLTQIDWKKGLSLVAQKIHAVKGEEIFAFSGAFTDVETLVTMKDFMTKLGSTNIYLDRCYWHGHEPFPKLDKQNYIFNSSIAGIDRADQILLIGTNPKKEAPLLNCRIRKRWLESNATIFSIGLPEETNLTYDYANLGSTLTNQSVDEFFKYNNKESKSPMIIVGSNIFGNKNASSITSIINNQIAPSIPNLNTKNWNGMNMLHHDSSTVGALDVGWTFIRPTELTKDTKCKVLFLLGADSKIPLDLIDSDTFVIYIGHNGDVGAEYAHLILPGQAYTEKNAIYVNTEGRVQRTTQAVPGPGDSREDWSIVRAMAELCSVTLNYSSKEELYERIYLEHPHLVTNFGELPKTNITLASSFKEAIPSKFDYSFQLPIDDYYMTDCISRASKTMAACSKEFSKQTTTSPIK